MLSRKFLAVTLAITAMLFTAACEDKKEGAQSAGPGAMPPPLVSVMKITEQDYPFDMNFQAVTQGSRAVEVRARVQALIKERLYTEGEYVKEGQILFQLERDQYEARMNQAKAQFEQAEREWNRIRPLYAKNAVSQKERDVALAAYSSAQADMRLAQINLDYCQVTAPVAGYSGKEEVTAGNLVNNGTLMTSINQTNPIYVNFSFPGTTYLRNKQLADAGRLALPEGNAYTATLRLVNGNMYPIEGKVTFVDSQVNQATGVVKARATFENKNDAVYPGQYARIFLKGAVLKNAILVPQRAILNTQMGSVAMVVGANNVVEMRPVKVTMNVEQMYLLEAGLKAGETIIIDGLVKARPGAPVTIAPPQGSPAGAQPGAANAQSQAVKDGDAVAGAASGSEASVQDNPSDTPEKP